MVSFADPITRDELSRLAEGAEEQSSLNEFVNSLDYSLHEKTVILDSLSGLPNLSENPETLASKSPDLFSNDWWN